MSPPLVCADRSGFLFAHACDRPATGACSVCGKAICVQHTRMRATGPTCIGCLRDERDEPDDRDGELTITRSSRSSDDPPGGAEAPEGHFGGGGAGAGGEWPGPESAARADDPYFFPCADRAAYYDADDHAAFDAPGEPDAEGAGADTDTGAS